MSDSVFLEGVGGCALTPEKTEQNKRLRRRKPGDLAQLRSVLWGVLLDVEAICGDKNSSNEIKIKAGHSIATLAGAYLKATEQGTFEERLARLEEIQKGRLTN